MPAGTIYRMSEGAERNTWTAMVLEAPPMFEGSLTMGDLFAAAGIDPSQVLLLRHTNPQARSQRARRPHSGGAPGLCPGAGGKGQQISPESRPHLAELYGCRRKPLSVQWRL